MIRVDIFIVTFPGHIDPDPLCLEDEFADFILLAVFAGLDIFPAEGTTTDGTRDVTDNVLASHQIARNVLVLKGIGKCSCGGLDVACIALDEKGSAMSSGESLADDLGGQT